MTTLLLLLTGALAGAAPPAETVSLVVNGGIRVCKKGKPDLGCRMPDLAAAKDVKIELVKKPVEEGQVGDVWHGAWSHSYADGGAKFTLHVAVTKASEPDSPDSPYSMEFRIEPESMDGGLPQVLRMSLANPKNLNRFRWDGAVLPGGPPEEEASPVLYFGLD